MASLLYRFNNAIKVATTTTSGITTKVAVQNRSSATTTLSCRRFIQQKSSFSTNTTTTTTTTGRIPLPPSPRVFPPKGNTTAGTTSKTTTISPEANLYARTSNRGPVSWPSLFLVTVVAASTVAYYNIERERRLEQAMGQVVSSELDGWTPRPDYLAKRKFIQTNDGKWFPIEDGFGAPGKPAIGGPWSLVDLNGNLVTNKSFEGKWLLLYFGFARCPDICPSEMMKVAHVMDTLKHDKPDIAKNLVPIFVSIDPARDSIQALRTYAKDFHPDYIFLTGTPEQVKRMAKSYRVYFSKAEESDDGDYLVDHSIVIYFHDNTGDLADCFTQSMRPSDIIDKIIERMNNQMKDKSSQVVAA